MALVNGDLMVLENGDGDYPDGAPGNWVTLVEGAKNGFDCFAVIPPLPEPEELPAPVMKGLDVVAAVGDGAHAAVGAVA